MVLGAQASNLDWLAKESQHSRTNSRNVIGRNPSMVIPLLANQDLTPMLVLGGMSSARLPSMKLQ